MIELGTRKAGEYLAMGRQLHPELGDATTQGDHLWRRSVWRCKLTSRPWSSSSMLSTIASMAALYVVSCHSRTRARKDGASS